MSSSPPQPIGIGNVGARRRSLRYRYVVNLSSSTTAVFGLFLIARSFAALYSPIQDCDEIFNFWEPTHYLHHGYGLQTWELSPVYAIRSWLYLSLHALPLSLSSWLLSSASKSAQFYTLRFIFACLSSLCETRLYSAVSQVLNPRIAIIYVIISASSAGPFHAAVAYLPNTFGMYTVILAMSALIDWRGGSRTAQGLMWLGIGTVLGWPFIGLLAAPFVLEEILLAVFTGESSAAILRMIDGFVRSLIVLAIETCFDSFFFRRYTSVPFNIVLYNIFSGSKKGPNIYGTEPWHFYIRNLLINFNTWFILALWTWPLLIFRHRYQNKPASRLTLVRSLTVTLPFYVWLAVFTAQPHKEERFIYPIYPCIALNAAISLHIIVLSLSGKPPATTKANTTSHDTWTVLKLITLGSFILASIFLGVLRSAGIATAYSSPLSVYPKLQHPDLLNKVIKDSTNVCVGKEWYRFPSSYHLPNGSHLKFIRSEFAGLLPGEFSEIASYSPGFGLFPGTYLIPSNMNDENIDDPSKYSNIEICDFLVDSRYPGLRGSDLEPDYAADNAHWERIACEPFLDSGRTSFIGRLLWIPDRPFMPQKLRRRWGEYCLLKRRKT